MSYARSVFLRAAGAVVAISIWLGVIVFALAKLDTGLPASEGLANGWPFWILAVLITVVVALWLRRTSARPGWGHFGLGLLIPEVAFLVNRLVTVEVSVVFWLTTLVLVLLPLPVRPEAAAAS